MGLVQLRQHRRISTTSTYNTPLIPQGRPASDTEWCSCIARLDCTLQWHRVAHCATEGGSNPRQAGCRRDVIDPGTSPRHKNTNLGTATRNLDDSSLGQPAHNLSGPVSLSCPERAVSVLSSCTPLVLVLYHMNMSLSPGAEHLHTFLSTPQYM